MTKSITIKHGINISVPAIETNFICDLESFCPIIIFCVTEVYGYFRFWVKKFYSNSMPTLMYYRKWNHFRQNKKAH